MRRAIQRCVRFSLFQIAAYRRSARWTRSEVPARFQGVRL